MKSKIYTAQEMRDMAENITRVDVMDGLTCREHCYPVKQEVKSMLRHSAEVVERCEAEIAKLPYPPNADDVYMFKRLNYILRGGSRSRRSSPPR